MRRICALLLNLLAAIMVIGIVIAVVGFVVAVVAAVIGVIVLEASSTPVTVYGLLAVPVVGEFFAVGLIVLGVGVIIFFVALGLYGLVDFLCFILSGLVPRNIAQGSAQARRTPLDIVPEPKEVQLVHFHSREIRCLIAPLFPAGMMLLLAIPVALLLFLLLSGAGYGLGSPGVASLIIAMVVLICFFGLLLALAPILWCCKCRKRGDAASLLNPVLDALESTAAAIETAGGAIGNVKTAFDDAGDDLQKAGEKIGGFSISVPIPPLTDSLSHFGIAVPSHVRILTEDFGSHNKVPAGAGVAQNLLNSSGKALKDNGARLSGVKSKHDTAARALRDITAMLRTLTT